MKNLAKLSRPTVWAEFSPLAAATGAVNLGQGFPSWSTPSFVTEHLKDAANTPGPKVNQYCRAQCHMPLAESLAAEYNSRPSWKDLKVDPLTNVVSSLGVTQTMYIGFRSLLSEGDEVVLLEPAFDIYAPQVLLCGGVPKYVSLKTAIPESTDAALPLNANDVFQFDFEALEAAISDSTRVLVLNTPHNPTGKVFTRSELSRIAEIVSKYPNLIVFSDEVYEHQIFDKVNAPHISFATLPGMYERTLTLSSAGKTFSTTGWKVGWGIGPASIISKLTALQQWVCYSAPSVTQEAIARSLVDARKPYEGFDTFYDWLCDSYMNKRDFLCDALTEINMRPIVPLGGFFVCADTSHLTFPESVYSEDSASAPSPMPRDWALARYMTHTFPNVAVIPPSPFYAPENVKNAENYVRFCVCKTDEELEEAVERLKKIPADGKLG